MRVLTISLVAVTAVACAAPPTFTRAPLVPLHPVEAPSAPAGHDAVDSGRADRDQSAATPGAAVPRYDTESLAPTYRTVVETVEVEVPVQVEAPQPSVVYVNSGRGYSTYDDYLYSRRAYRAQRRGNRFPVNTLVGAGVGAIIGHQSGRRDRGALIGGGFGLLMDLDRWY